MRKCFDCIELNSWHRSIYPFIKICTPAYMCVDVNLFMELYSEHVAIVRFIVL